MEKRVFKVKEVLILILLCVLSLQSKAQDTIRITHTNYTTVFDRTLKYPVLVEWWDTSEKVTCTEHLPRKNQFQPDPQIWDETNLKSDYRKSGYDKGHMCPASDNECSGEQVLKECFYFSNMAPQTHSLNAGDWERVERLTRTLSVEYDSVHIWAGSIGEIEKIKSVSVPEKCWKVIHVLKTGEWHSYIMYIDREKPSGIKSHEVKLQDFEKLTGFNFFR